MQPVYLAAKDNICTVYPEGSSWTPGHTGQERAPAGRAGRWRSRRDAR
ncbi:hypothetical protein sce2116 [Sorangium cellulosum So ce56]|uniref:Uncharacterized protein n=1 Tax=Sorangium cellulosum (strain So ce56) TaxID=448385 RepID=A9FVG9_SORC5|nr:hypothetical protein sce2116 [Sorangium cellulosum So ce56]